MGVNGLDAWVGSDYLYVCLSGYDCRCKWVWVGVDGCGLDGLGG